MPVSDLGKLETMISIYGVKAGNNCDFLNHQLHCELDILIIHGVFGFSSFKLRVKLEMIKKTYSIE